MASCVSLHYSIALCGSEQFGADHGIQKVEITDRHRDADPEPGVVRAVARPLHLPVRRHVEFPARMGLRCSRYDEALGPSFSKNLQQIVIVSPITIELHCTSTICRKIIFDMF